MSHRRLGPYVTQRLPGIRSIYPTGGRARHGRRQIPRKFDADDPEPSINGADHNYKNGSASGSEYNSQRRRDLLKLVCLLPLVRERGQTNQVVPTIHTRTVRSGRREAASSLQRLMQRSQLIKSPSPSFVIMIFPTHITMKNTGIEEAPSCAVAMQIEY